MYAAGSLTYCCIFCIPRQRRTAVVHAPAIKKGFIDAILEWWFPKIWKCVILDELKSRKEQNDFLAKQTLLLCCFFRKKPSFLFKKAQDIHFNSSVSFNMTAKNKNRKWRHGTYCICNLHYVQVCCENKRKQKVLTNRRFTPCIIKTGQNIFY